MSIVIIDNLESMWIDSRPNNYSCLDDLDKYYGVYVFRDADKGDILYVGEAREQDLKTRIKQNFNEKDSGGTFKKNYIEKEKADFEGFKSFIKNKQLIGFSMDKSMLIRALESIFICTLKPKYNKDK